MEMLEFWISIWASVGVQHVGPDGQPLAWYEWIYANPGEVVRMNEPEFVVSVPQHAVPCEVAHREEWEMIIMGQFVSFLYGEYGKLLEYLRFSFFWQLHWV